MWPGAAEEGEHGVAEREAHDRDVCVSREGRSSVVVVVVVVVVVFVVVVVAIVVAAIIVAVAASGASSALTTATATTAAATHLGYEHPTVSEEIRRVSSEANDATDTAKVTSGSHGARDHFARKRTEIGKPKPVCCRDRELCLVLCRDSCCCSCCCC